MKLSEYFDSSEFACKCGCGGMNNGAGVNHRLVQVVETMRQLCGCPLELSCAYRCPDHNAEVGGVWNSQHVYGEAADVQTPPAIPLWNSLKSQKKLAQMALVFTSGASMWMLGGMLPDGKI